MFRKFACTVLTFAFCTVCLVAADYTGTVKKIEKGAEKGSPSTLVLTVKDADKEIMLAKGAKLIDASGTEVTGKDRGKAMKAPQGQTGDREDRVQGWQGIRHRDQGQVKQPSAKTLPGCRILRSPASREIPPRLRSGLLPAKCLPYFACKTTIAR